MPTIAIDFDGTICRPSWPDIGAATPGAVEAVRRLKEAGHVLILWTCREGASLTKARLWLNEQGLGDCFDEFNEHTAANRSAFNNDTRKIGADFYIDDRALGCPKTADGDVDWSAILAQLVEPAEERGDDFIDRRFART